MTAFPLPPSDAGVIAAAPCATPCGRSAAPWILAATILASSMVFIDGTVVNVALPALQQRVGREPGRRAMGRRSLRAVSGGARCWSAARPAIASGVGACS